ncbi:hypothetical protein APA_4383 [Pseudanabaena sp. lw0831]|nr:hypothetical protein APA_4383 [Pseudanabaena sp. lw0831]
MWRGEAAPQKLVPLRSRCEVGAQDYRFAIAVICINGGGNAAPLHGF